MHSHDQTTDCPQVVMCNFFYLPTNFQILQNAVSNKLEMKPSKSV